MSKLSSPAWMMAAFFAGIFFVYSCGGGGDYANLAIGVEGGLPALTEEVNALKQRVAELETALGAISDDGTTLTITGRNLQIISGSGSTDDGCGSSAPCGTLSGLGNLIIGYNEDENSGGTPPDDAPERGGSHNLVIGSGHKYSSYGGLVAGYDNAVRAPHATVSGGRENTASEVTASVSGGKGNIADERSASISGGLNNRASGRWAAVSGGSRNRASGINSSVSGGSQNMASGDYSSVSGGQRNTAGKLSSVSGGQDNIADGEGNSVSGGQYCLRSGSAGNSSWGIGGATDVGPARPENCSVTNDGT